jgi:hypothetical protein
MSKNIIIYYNILMNDYIETIDLPRDREGYLIDNNGVRLNEYSGDRNNILNPGNSRSYFNVDGTPREGFNQYGISLLGYHATDGMPWTVDDENEEGTPQIVNDRIRQLRNTRDAPPPISARREPSRRIRGEAAPINWDGDRECSGKDCVISHAHILNRNGINPGIKLSDGQCYLASELAKYWKSSDAAKNVSPVRNPYTAADKQKINDYLSVISGGKRKTRKTRKTRKSRKTRKTKTRKTKTRKSKTRKSKRKI